MNFVEVGGPNLEVTSGFRVEVSGMDGMGWGSDGFTTILFGVGDEVDVEVAFWTILEGRFGLEVDEGVVGELLPSNTLSEVRRF